MTIDLALEYIPRRMKELGYGDEYHLQLRHLVLRPHERRKVHAINQLYILIEPSEMLCIKSDSGVFDLTKDLYNELQYEHQGNIRLRNYSILPLHARFIQVIPKMKDHAGN
jgi:hypothetical protein